MNYPLISEYIEAIMSAEDNFDQLSSLRPVLDSHGIPVMSSGNFAVVFKMKDIDTGKFYAVKCFIKDQEGRCASYKKICDEINSKKTPYLISCSYYDYELFVDSTQTSETDFPIILMDWVDGIPLENYIDLYYGNPFVLYELCYNFRKFSQWMVNQSFAHGDVKPDNILVRDDGQIVLIDYDGMFVPSMRGEIAREEGTPDYRNPYYKGVFDSHIDDFSLAVIALSLKLISMKYNIRREHLGCNGLLFSREDYINKENNEIFKYVESKLGNEPLLGQYYATFIKSLSGNKLSDSDFNFKEEKEINSLLSFWPEYVSIRNTDKIKRGRLDRNGLIYSIDGTTVIGYDCEHPYNDEEIFIKEGTIAICEDAFDQFTPKLRLHFPSSLRYFCSKSLNYRYSRITWDTPWYKYLDGFIYTKDKTECIIKSRVGAKFDDSTLILGIGLFADLSFDGKWPMNLKRIRKKAFCRSLVAGNIYIPEGVVEIGDMAFQDCDVKAVFLPATLKSLGYRCFLRCYNLEEIVFNENCKIEKISSSAFCNNKKLSNIIFSNAIKQIGDSAFKWCGELKKLNLPDSLEIIGERAFEECEQIKEIIFPQSLRRIEEKAFGCCTNLLEINFNSKIELVGNAAFFECKKLTKLNYKYIDKIEKNAFVGCPLELEISDYIGEIVPGAITGVKIMKLISKNYIIDGYSLYSRIQKELIYNWGQQRALEIKDGISNIDKDAFVGNPICIVLPSSYDEKNIGNACFVSVLVVPNHFEECAFREGTIISHEKVYIDDYGVIYSEDKRILKRYNYNIDAEVYEVDLECTEIEEYAFVGDIDYDPEFGAEYYGNTLKKVILPPHLKKIGAHAFEGCRVLEKIHIPNSTKCIDDGAFNGCHMLSEIVLSSELEKLGVNVFPRSLKSIQCLSPHYFLIGGCLMSKKNELLWMPSNIKELNLPSEITYNGIECYAYYNSIVTKNGELIWTIPNILSFEFPKNVRVIGNNAFSYNRNIVSLVIPNGVLEIKRGAWGCNQSLTDIYLPSTIQKIEDLHTYQGWGRKYIEFFYPKRIHIPKGMKSHFLKLLPDVTEQRLIEDYN